MIFFFSPHTNDLFSLGQSEFLVDFQIWGDSLVDELLHFMA